MRVAILSSIANQKSKIKNCGVGGGVWESNPPAPALTGALTVLKTAPLTRTGAPPRRRGRERTLSGRSAACQALTPQAPATDADAHARVESPRLTRALLDRHHCR